MNKKTIGRMGEDMAETYLISRGYRVLHRNYRNRYGEIDIIAKKNGRISFVEVKTRFSDCCGTGREAVNYNKMSHIKSCVKEYISRTKWGGEVGIDVIEINLSHIINVE